MWGDDLFVFIKKAAIRFGFFDRFVFCIGWLAGRSVCWLVSLVESVEET